MLMLRRATSNDRPSLIELLKRANMDYVEPASDYMLAVEGKNIVGCARLEDHDDMVMLRPLVIDENHRRKGVGRYIIKNIIHDDKHTVVAARGKSVPFYKSIGFIESDWQSLSDDQRAECRLCPEQEVCKPQPMVYMPERYRK